MSEEARQHIPEEAERERGMLTLSYPIKLPPGLLSQTALQLKALEPDKDVIGELFPRAYQLLCEEQNFLSIDARELAFIATHGRRWKAGEGIDYSKFPTVPELVFDRANLEASCEMLRSQFKVIKLARKNPTLAEHVRECHRAIHRAQEARKELLGARWEPDAYGVAEKATRHLRVTALFSLAAKSGSSGIIWTFGASGYSPQRQSGASWRNVA